MPCLETETAAGKLVHALFAGKNELFSQWIYLPITPYLVDFFGDMLLMPGQERQTSKNEAGHLRGLSQY